LRVIPLQAIRAEPIVPVTTSNYRPRKPCRHGTT